LIHPAVRDLFLELGRHPGFAEATHQLTAGHASGLSGLTTTAKAAYIVLLWQSTQRPLLVVVDGNKEAETLSEAVQTFYHLLAADARSGPQLLPALDVLPLQNLSPHAELSEQRAVGLWRLATQRVPITILPLSSASKMPTITANSRSSCGLATRCHSTIWPPIWRASATSAVSPSRWWANTPYAAASWTFSRPKPLSLSASTCSAIRSNQFAASKWNRSAPS
jgi:hypothetical protein